MKRLVDILAAAIGLCLLSPLLVIIALLILLIMGWPPFYRQVRVGRDGAPFRIIKFRTMVRDADRNGLALTTGQDPRITPLGRLLRKTKSDELPQLLNVLVGHMSLVGPRPEVPQYVQMYNPEQRQVLTVRPGLTDPASIVYRDEEKVLARYADAETAYVQIIMPAKLRLNMAYIEKATLATDLALIFKTLGKLFNRR